MLYIFDKDDNFKNIITEDTGLIDTWFKDYQNHLIDEPFVFHVDSESELLPLIVAENQVAFKHTFNALQQDVEMLKLMRIKEIDEIYNNDGYIVEVTCEPSWLELYDHFIEDRRIENGTSQTAMNRALQGSRWVGQVAGEFGNGSTNFYWIDAVEALFKIAEEWGGTLQDYITLDENNEIATRIMYLLPRLGRDNGLLIQPDYNAETIERRTLSYPVTAIWGQGASLEIEDEEGNHTGGYTRYITFEDVEWKRSKGDPVDKPKGQKWVGDPQALAKYGYLKDDGTRMHRFGHFSNQDYETPEELLWATWEALQEEKDPEIYHEAVIDEVDKPIFLGDTGTILDRHYGKPIEVQSQITGLEYDVLRPMENVKTVLGNYKDMSRDPLEDEIDEIKQNQKRPVIVDKGNFPNKKPMKPTNVEAVGGWETIQVTWDYTDEIYVSHYEVYASQNKDFVPDSQFLVYNGKVSAFGHEVKTDEVWYYRVCSVNYHGVKSEFSDEATASTIRIPLDATNFESIVTDTKNRADEAFDNANIATQNAVEAIGIAQEGFDKSLEAIDGLTTLNEFVDEQTGEITRIKGDVQGLQTTVSKKVDESTFSTFVQQTNNSIAGKISMADAEGVFVKETTFSATVDGLQTTVSDVQGDVVNLTVISNAMQARLTNAEGDINELTLTSQSLVTRIGSLANPNLITHNPEGWLKVLNFIGLEGGVSVKQNTDYILTDFSAEKVDNIQVNFGSKSIDIGEDGTLVFNSGDDNSVGIIVSTNDSEFFEKLGTVYRFKLEEGTESTTWTAHDDDTYTQYSQLQDAINLRVKKGDVMSQINIEADRVLISTDGKLVLDAESTLISNAIIKDAHIESLNGQKIVSKSITTDQLNVNNLGAITANLGTVTGGHITQQSSGKRLEMFGGDIESYSNNKLAMKFGNYSLDFYNRNETLLGQVVPLVNENNDTYEGLGLIVENDFINIGMRQGGFIRPVLRSSFYDNTTILSGPYNNANVGASLQLYANRRLVSEDRFSGSDQPTIILDQSDTTNNLTMFFGGFSNRNNATFQVRHRTSGSSSANRIEANANGVYLGGRVTGASSATGNILGSGGEAYYENASGSNTLSRADALKANGICVIGNGSGHFYLGTLDGGELRVTNGNGRNNGGTITYRAVRASAFNESSSREYKTDINTYEGNALDVVNSLTVVNFRFKDDIANGVDDLKIGFIAEDSEPIASKDGKAIQSYALGAYNTKAIQELTVITDDLDAKINLTREELVLKIAKLEQRINELESAA